MRIALFTDTYLPDVNGVVTSVVLLKNELIKLGHEVYVVSNYPGVSKIKEEENGHLIRLPGLELKKLYGYKMTQPFHLLFINELKDLKIDIIHAQQEFGIGMYASIVAKTLKIPLVRTYHTAYEDYTSYFLPLPIKPIDNAAKKGIEVFSKIVGEDCMRLVAPSNKTKNMLINYGIRTPITVIPTGLEIERFKPDNQNIEEVNNIRKELNINDSTIMFIYVGRIANEKSIDLIISGFRRIKEEKLNSKLVIVGGGPAYDDLVEMTNTLELNDYIIFTGKKPNTDVPKYYNASDVFVSASTSETQGLTYIEALSSGLPLICKKDTVLDDILIDHVNGLFFETDIDFGEKAVEFIKMSKDKKDEYSKNALKEAHQFDANLFALNMVNMYKEVIDEYNSGLKISKIGVKGDNVLIHLEGDQINDKINVTIDTYTELGLRQGDILSTHIINRLKNEEKIALAYDKCLKRLGYKDYSEREMRDYLYIYNELPQRDIDFIINKLKTNNFIDDEKYAFNKVTSFKNMLYSNRMMVRKLKEAGINEDIINKIVKSEKDEELIKAKKIAERYNLLINGKSLKLRKELLIKKLCDKGFNYDVSKSAIDYLDFSTYSIQETEVLRNECIKYGKKYSKKYEGRDLRNKIYTALVSKGFNSEDVYAIISELEEEYGKTS